jgi:hypothetical protein
MVPVFTVSQKTEDKKSAIFCSFCGMGGQAPYCLRTTQQSLDLHRTEKCLHGLWNILIGRRVLGLTTPGGFHL